MLQLESVVQKLAHLMAQQDPAPGAPSPAAEEEEQEPHEWRDWLSLPPEVLHQFLLPCAATEAAEPPRLRAAFASCTALARAALHVSRARLAVNVDRQRHLARGAQVLQRLWSAGAQGASLELHSGGYGTPGRFLAALHSGGVRLDCVSLLVFKGLSLDALIPAGTHRALPQLAELHVTDCRLTQAAASSLMDTACGKLRHVQIKGLLALEPRRNARRRTEMVPVRRSAVATVQLEQLAGLPSLASLCLRDSACNLEFLDAMGSQLTCLELDPSFLDVDMGGVRSAEDAAAAQRLVEDWVVQQGHVLASCSELRSLSAPIVAGEQLAGFAHLCSLHLNQQGLPACALDGDATVEALLRLPQLTELRWRDARPYKLQRWFTSPEAHACSWRRLSFEIVTPRVLAHLPLHSLQRRFWRPRPRRLATLFQEPVAWTVLSLDRETSVDEARAAAANLQRFCKAGHRWVPGDPGDVESATTVLCDEWFEAQGHGATPDDAPAALLRALGPLFAGPSLACLAVCDLRWDEDAVRAMGQVLPRTCAELLVDGGGITAGALQAVARRLPWLRLLGLLEVEVEPGTALAYLRDVRSMRADGGAGGEGEVRCGAEDAEQGGVDAGVSSAAAAGGEFGVALERLWVLSPEPVGGGGDGGEAWRAAWARAREEVDGWGADVELDVEWAS